jgi:hypothetical protein
MFGSIDSTKSPASGIATASEPRLMSQVGGSARSCARVDQCVSAIGAVGRQCSCEQESASLPYVAAASR